MSRGMRSQFREVIKEMWRKGGREGAKQSRSCIHNRTYRTLGFDKLRITMSGLAAKQPDAIYVHKKHVW